jgi:hypothetical protein
MKTLASSPECQLDLIALLYAAWGLVGLEEFAVGLFTPVEHPLASLTIGVNVSPFLLLLGIGLARRSESCRKLAVAVSWLGILLLSGLAVMLTYAEKREWTPTEGMTRGDSIARWLAFASIVVPVFVWQLVTLSSQRVRSLTSRRTEAVTTS